MERQVVTIPADATYEEAARLLVQHQIGGAPVVDAGGDLVGIVSEKDLYRILYPLYQSYYEQPELYSDLEGRESKLDEVRDHPIERFMSRNVVTISPDVPVMHAGAVMLARRMHRLPVVEGRKLVGIITRRKIYLGILGSQLSLPKP